MGDILLVGGSGFIGSHVASRLQANSHRVAVFDIVPPTRASGAEYHRGDVFDAQALAPAMRGKAAVVSLVGLADIGRCQKHPDESFHLNVESLSAVLEASRRADVRRIVFPSSAAVYGKVETVPIDETTIPNPASVYGWHKLMGELDLRAYRQSYGLNYVILRLFNVVGSGNKGVIHHYVESALESHAIRGFGRDQLRDFVDASDVAEAFTLAAAKTGIVDKVINIGSGQGIRIAELAAMIQSVVPGTSIEFEEKADYIPYHSVADITLAKNLLDFRPRAGRDAVQSLVKELVGRGR